MVVLGGGAVSYKRGTPVAQERFDDPRDLLRLPGQPAPHLQIILFLK